MKIKFIDYYESPIGLIQIKADENKINHVNFIKNEIEIIESKKSSELTKLAIFQLSEYFKRRLKKFNLPLNINGTNFQNKVWQELLKIPFGKTCSYLDIAKNINNIKAVRAVGKANNKNPIAIIIPCHRVIGKNGKLVGYTSGIDKKEFLLNNELSNY